MPLITAIILLTGSVGIGLTVYHRQPHSRAPGTSSGSIAEGPAATNTTGNGQAQSTKNATKPKNGAKKTTSGPSSATGTSSAQSSSGSASGGSSGSGSAGACSGSIPAGYTSLAFCDDFSGTAGSAPDSSKWNVYGGTTPNRWGEECFVNDRQHIYQDGSGHLVETATSNPGGVPCNNGSGLYESGGMDTGNFPNPLFSFHYGQVEAKIKVPCESGAGMWPAWWMTGPSWPNGGEIDMLEILNNANTGFDAKQSVHGAISGGGVWSIGHHNVSTTLWCNAYHIYGLNWSPNRLDFTIDGTVTATTTPADMKTGWIWPFESNSAKLFIDLQVGGSGGTVDNSTLPQSMLVDWIRIYR